MAKNNFICGDPELVLQGIEIALKSNYSATETQSDLLNNLDRLGQLSRMTKFELEAFFSQITLICLNDKEYTRLQQKITSLKKENEDACTAKGIQIPSLFE